MENLEIMVLMADRCTKKEAERYLKNGAIVYDSVSEYIEELKKSEVYSGETEEEIRDGRVEDVAAVEYEGHEYCIMYVR